MLRLLFTNEDNSSQLTVITDGIDSQQNIFVTENPIGKVDEYASMGVAVEVGKLYNLGTLMEIAEKSGLRLISYPEGLDEGSRVLVEIKKEPVITYKYNFDVIPTEITFPPAGGTKNVMMASTRQKYEDGKAVGYPENHPFELGMVSEGINVTDIYKISMGANTTSSERSGTVYYNQKDSGITIVVTVKQEAVVAP